MTRYHVVHRTEYRYGAPISAGHTIAHLTPRDTARQICRNHKLIIKPSPAISLRRLDGVGPDSCNACTGSLTHISLWPGPSAPPHLKTPLSAPKL